MAHTLSMECVSPQAFFTCWDSPHSVCGLCFSLNKSTSYPSLCLSLNSFCDETSRTWASFKSWNQVCDLSWKTVGFGQVQVPVRVLARFESQPCGSKSQSGFRLISSPNLRCTVSLWLLYPWLFSKHISLVKTFQYLLCKAMPKLQGKK